MSILLMLLASALLVNAVQQDIPSFSAKQHLQPYPETTKEDAVDEVGRPSPQEIVRRARLPKIARCD